MIDLILLNPYIYYLVMFGYIAFVLVHEVRVAIFIRQSGMRFGYWDRLMLFRNPLWKTRAELSDIQLTCIRKMAWQFAIATLITVAFFSVGYIVFASHAYYLETFKGE